MEIGNKIKRLRLQRGLTQEELADRCELSKGFISLLERDLTSPSIATLVDILESLGSDLKSFFSETGHEKLVFGEDDIFVKEDEEGIRGSIRWLVPSAQKNQMEPILLTLHPKGKSHILSAHHGEEFGYVLKGNVTLVRENKKYKLKAQETFYLDGSKSHYLYNHGSSDAKVLWITTPPMF